MLYKLALFVHVLCNATLLGGLSVLAMQLRASLSGSKPSEVLQQTQHINTTMMAPTAAASLITGLYLLSQHMSKPAWLLVKERLGGLVLFVLILFIFTLGRTWAKQSISDSSLAQTTTRRYLYTLNLMIALLALLLFAATYKF